MKRTWETAFEELAGQRQGRLLAFATVLAGRDAAEDLVQDAVIATFSKHRGFEHVAQAEQYVRRAIATKYLDGQRRSRAVRMSEARAARPEAVDDGSRTVDARCTLEDALAGLPPRVRACVALRYLDDLSVRETAQTLGLSEGAVKRYVSDGLSTLNRRLGTSEELSHTNNHPDTITVTHNGGTR